MTQNKTTPAVRTGQPVSTHWSTSAKAAVVALIALFLWSYWPVFGEMANKWASDPQYSHSYLVPAFCLLLLWRGRGQGKWLEPNWNWWGAGLLLIAVALRIAGARLFVDWLEAISLLSMLAGTVLLLAGWPALKQTWPAIAFLTFMIPLPYRVETGLSQPLQRMATNGSTYILQMIGRPAFAEGNVIVVNDIRVGVIEACNGLGMFLLFFALSAAVAMLIHRPWWEKAILVVSALPIAIGVNIFRISTTTLVHELFDSSTINAWVHDLAGWIMMPLALITLIIELKVLSKLFVENTAAKGLGTASPTRGTGSRSARDVPPPPRHRPDVTSGMAVPLV